MINKQKIQNEKGISLIELVVAVAIFSVVIIAAVGIFISAMKAQKAMLAKQNMADSLRYTMEYMVKELRMAQIDTVDSALTFKKDSSDIAGFKNDHSSSLYFKNSAGDSVQYSLSGNKILKDVQPISSNEVKIISLNFTINNWSLVNDPTDGKAPLITIYMKAEAKSGAGGDMELQTSVSPRIY